MTKDEIRRAGSRGPRAILIANAKGGVGKTTFATTIAAAIAAQGRRVALADADRQRSSLLWLSRRSPTEARIDALDWSRAREIGRAPAALNASLDWLVIDAPGAVKGARAEALAAQASAIVTPIAPSLFDAYATRAFLLRAENLATLRDGGAELLVAANRVRRHGRLARDLTEFFVRVEIEPVAEIAERAVYAELAAQGLAVFDRQGPALEPVKRQWAPLLGRLGLVGAPPRRPQR